MDASAYIAFCSEGCTGRTRLGIDVSNTTTYQGRTVVAVDPDVVPLHSLLKIETKGGKVIHGIAADTGGKIDNLKLDILVGTYEEAVSFGRQPVTVTILREGK